ncbi:hypothetical protein FFT09_03530 [Saccharomonospora piscinae]|nr:hypothetical protein FFT09_03530 [Saccharomonospora piscinae]
MRAVAAPSRAVAVVGGGGRGRSGRGRGHRDPDPAVRRRCGGARRRHARTRLGQRRGARDHSGAVPLRRDPRVVDHHHGGGRGPVRVAFRAPARDLGAAPADRRVVAPPGRDGRA